MLLSRRNSVLAVAALVGQLWLGQVCPAAESPVLEHDVLPILTRHCLGCHGGLRQFGKLDMRTLPAMLAGGESGPSIARGHADQSLLWQRIASDEMPEGDDREKLSPREKEIVKGWIDAGLPTVSQRLQKVDPLLPAGSKHEPPNVAAAIDRHLQTFLASARLEPAALADDAEFLRRVYLDLTGRIPTPEQAVEFLDSDAPDRRARLIDQLLDSPQFGAQFGRTWRDWVCPPELPSDDNGGAQPHQQANEFGAWLGKKVVAGEPWDRVVRDILTVEGPIKGQPQVIFYGLAGQGGKTSADGTARAVASLFLGVQLQCAQCHDDPYRDWSQEEHWALAAFFGRMQGDFTKIESGKGPSKAAGQIEIPEAAFKRAGATVPAAFLRGSRLETPRDDLRPALADWLVAQDNPYFAKAFANRLWFYLFARGIVNPIDDLRELNPPSHPGLLELLANEFRDSGYDVKHLLRCLCNSQAYQRTSRLPPQTDEQARHALTLAFGRMPLRTMSADMLLDSLKLAFGEEKEFDLRNASKDSTVGQAATVGDAYQEFRRKFSANEEDAADFTHGVAQMLTFLNHPRLLTGSKALEEHVKKHPDATADEILERLYLSTLSRRPTPEEREGAAAYVQQIDDPAAARRGLLWMLVNRSEFVLIR